MTDTVVFQLDVHSGRKIASGHAWDSRNAVRCRHRRIDGIPETQSFHSDYVKRALAARALVVSFRATRI